MSQVKISQDMQEYVQKIAGECMGTEDAYCKSRCPMSTDAKLYVHLIGEGKYEEALKVIREKLFLPGTLGRICAHPCEEECRREREFQEAVSIAALKRFAADRADDEALWDVHVGEDTGKSVAIVGSGPAGAQAAIDLRKKGHRVTVYEKNEKRGGMLRVGIPRYRLPREVLDREYTYLDKLGIEFKMNTEVGKDVTLDELRQQYDVVLLAQGAHMGNVVKVPGYDAKGVFTATEYLKEIAETDSFPRAGEKILIIGGGDVAMDCARSSVRLGAKEVLQCSLESYDILPANREESDGAQEEGVKCNFGWGPDEIFVKDGAVSGIRMKKVKSVFDEQGKFNPSYEEEYQTFGVDTIIMATGQIVEDVADGAIPRIGGGRYKCDKETLATNMENVFVAGDAAGGKIVVEAMALGRKAAISIERFLNGEDLKKNRDFKQEWAYETALDVPLPAETEDVPRTSKNLRPAEERIQDFEPVDIGFTEEQARKEASRCLQCQCRLCFTECVMMDSYAKCPGEIFGDVLNSGKADYLMVYSCNDCDSCGKICPKELPIKDGFMKLRQEIAANHNGTSPMAGHRAVRIHQTMGFASVYTTKVMGGEK